MTGASPSAAGRVRLAVWAIHLTLPALALWLLVAQPELDIAWQHNPSHFGLVTVVAAANLWLALRMQAAARSRSDPRMVLVALAFTLSAGFLLLHALATPGVLADGPNLGFEITTPVGLLLAALLLALASRDLGSSWPVRRQAALGWGTVGLLVVWEVAAVAGLGLLSTAPVEEDLDRPVFVMATLATAAYLYAAVGFFRIHRRRPSVMLVALVTASALLAEAMVTVVFAPNWRLSWWLWHLLMTFGFGYFVYSSYVQLRREGEGAGLFDGIGTDDTYARIRAEYADLLESLTDALDTGNVGAVTAATAARFGLTEGQASVLGRAAEALARERDHARRQAVLARLGAGTRVRMDETALLSMVLTAAGEGFGDDRLRIGLLRDGVLEFPPELQSPDWTSDPSSVSRPLSVAGIETGVIEVTRPNGSFSATDLSIFDTLASEVGMALENLRLYAQVEGLFRQYTSPDVASALLADPAQARLGGTVMEVTALFADLRGFTSFSEASSPEQVVEMLNRYAGWRCRSSWRKGAR